MKNWGSDLPKDQVAIADAYFREITNDATKPIIVAADAVVKHIPESNGLLNLTEQQRATTHAVAIAVWKRLFTDPIILQRIDKACITAGPPGAGKSTLHQNLGPRCATYDCTFSHDLQYEKQRMNAPLDAGINLTISYVHRPPEQSIPATMNRANKGEHRCIGKMEHFTIPTRAIRNIEKICEDGLVDFSAHATTSPRQGDRAKIFLQAYKNAGSIKEACNKKSTGPEALLFLQKQLKEHYANEDSFREKAGRIIQDHAIQINMDEDLLRLCLQDGHPKPPADPRGAPTKRPPNLGDPRTSEAKTPLTKIPPVLSRL